MQPNTSVCRPVRSFTPPTIDTPDVWARVLAPTYIACNIPGMFTGSTALHSSSWSSLLQSILSIPFAASSFPTNTHRPCYVSAFLPLPPPSCDVPMNRLLARPSPTIAPARPRGRIKANTTHTATRLTTRLACCREFGLCWGGRNRGLCLYVDITLHTCHTELYATAPRGTILHTTIVHVSNFLIHTAMGHVSRCF